eukprot:591196-Rhodomonas_salina.1
MVVFKYEREREVGREIRFKASFNHPNHPNHLLLAPHLLEAAHTPRTARTRQCANSVPNICRGCKEREESEPARSATPAALRCQSALHRRSSICHDGNTPCQYRAAPALHHSCSSPSI